MFSKLYTNSAGFLFRLVESNRSLIILDMEFIHIFQYGEIFNKMSFSNFNLLNKALLIVGSRVSQSEDQKIFPLQYGQFRGFTEIKLLQKLSMSPNKEVFKFLDPCLLSYITLHHLHQLSQYFFVSLIYFGIVQMVL